MWLAGVSVDCSNYNDLASFRQIGVFRDNYFSSGIYFSCLLRTVQKLYLCGNQNVTRNDYSLLFDWQDSNKQTEDMIDYRSYAHNVSSCEIKDWKKITPERDSNPGTLRYPCSALPTELSADWELVTLWVRNIPVDGEEFKWTWARSYTWNAAKDMKTWLISQLCTQVKQLWN